MERDVERLPMKEGVCQNCSHPSLLIKGFCDDCTPASYRKYYEEWNSRQGQIERVIMAEQVLSERVLERADQQPQDERGEKDQK